MPSKRCDVAEALETDTRRELERLRVQVQLIRRACDRSVQAGTAFGGEVTLALRIRSILDDAVQQ